MVPVAVDELQHGSKQNSQPGGWPLFAALDRLLLVVGSTEGYDLYIHLGKTGLGDLQLLGGGVGEVDDAPLGEDTPIIDSHYDRFPGVEINHAHDAAKRQGGVAGRHGVHVELLTTGRAMAVEYRAVPRGNAVEFILNGSGNGLWWSLHHWCRAQDGGRRWRG